MALRWLEERLAKLLPVLDALGQEQEEELRVLCEAEKEAWRQRPRMKAEISLNVPMIQTRNRIREELFLRDDNWWINPKSGEKEHIALKHMNFSTEEWTRMALPKEEVLQTRLAQPLVLSDPDGVVQQGEMLLQMDAWPELVLGIMLNTGRTLAEILKTGVFRVKTPYSLQIAVPMTVHERLTPFFEVPTFARAERIVEAIERVRWMFGMQFAFTDRRAVGRQCHPLVRQVAFQHFMGLVPLRLGEQDLHKTLSQGVYARLAVSWYCPPALDELIYLATIKHFLRVLDAPTEEERLTLAIASSFLDYVLVGPDGKVDPRKGIHLGDPEVEVVEVFQQRPDESASVAFQKSSCASELSAEERNASS